MRKELIEDIKNQPSYNCLKNILNEKTDNKLGVQLSSSPVIRSMLINAISNIKPELAKKDEIIKYLGLIDDEKIDNETKQQIIDRIKTNTESLLKAIKEEKIKMKDSILKAFLYYIQKVLSLEYKNKNNIPKRRYYKHAKDIRCDVSLFPSGSPKIEDIKQGNLGDCYLLAALISIINKDAKLIKKCFLNKEYNLETKYVKIKLYRVKVHMKLSYDKKPILVVLPLNPIVIQIDNTFLIKEYKINDGNKPKPFGNRTAALWVNFMEKAFSVYKNIKDAVVAGDDLAKIIVDKWAVESDHSLSGQNANGGFEFIPFCAITGKKSSSKSVEGIQNILLKYNDASSQFNYSPEENKVFNYIHTKLQKGKVLTVSTYSEIERTFDKDTRKQGLYPTHAYSIDSTIINQGQSKKYIVLYNPHMAKELIDPESTSAVVGATPEKMEKGKIKCELSNFIKYFKDINKTNLNKI